MKTYILFLSVVFVVFTSSCSIEKRHYLPGYHIQWNNKSKARNFAKEKLANESAKDVVESSSLQEEPLDESFLAGVSNSNPVVRVKQKTKRVFNADCDSIFLKDGSLVLAKVISIKNNLVVYKLCRDIYPNLVYEEDESKIHAIKYADGRKENLDKMKKSNDVLTSYIVNDTNVVCDTIYFADGSIVYAKWIKLNDNVYSYVNFNDEGNTIFYKHKIKLNKIAYRNGDVVIIDKQKYYEEEKLNEIQRKRVTFLLFSPLILSVIITIIYVIKEGGLYFSY